MAFDFPASPTLDQEYISGGVTFVWNGNGWLMKGSSSINPADFVKKAGDTMTGFLLLNADPLDAMGAATRQWTDTKLPKSGGTMTGNLTLALDPSAALHAATKQYVDTKALNATDPTKLPLVGGTLTGPLGISVGSGLNSYLSLNKTDVASACDIYGGISGKTHWLLRLGSGGAADPFQILAADDAGTITSTPLSINRATGNATFAGATTTTNAISLGSAAVTAPNDLSRHIQLYSNTFGFSITSGTLNVVAGSTAHPFTASGATITGTLTVTANAQVNGTLTANNTVKAGVALQTASWGGDINQGLIYLNGQGNAYLHFNTAQLNCTHPIAGNNGRLWGASDGTPRWDGQPMNTAASIADIGYGGYTNSIQILSVTPTEPSISFHRQGAFAMNFGMDNGGDMTYGGWSHGAARYRLLSTRYQYWGSQNLNGWFRLDNGFIIQWGAANLAGDGWVYFPVAFPNWCSSVTANTYTTSSPASEIKAVHIHLVQNNAFYIQPRYATSGGGYGVATQLVLWMAVGC